MNNQKIALMFAGGYSGKHGNVEIVRNMYKLFGHTICKRDVEEGKDVYTFNWCGWYTRSTARHINYILSAIDSSHRVSYADARNNSIDEFKIYGGA